MNKLFAALLAGFFATASFASPTEGLELGSAPAVTAAAATPTTLAMAQHGGVLYAKKHHGKKRYKAKKLH